MQMPQLTKAWWGAIVPFTGLPVIAVILLVLVALGFFLGIAFIWKHLMAITVGVVFLLGLFYFVKNKKISPRFFIGAIILFVFVYFIGSYLGLLALGMQNQKASIDINIDNSRAGEINTLATGTTTTTSSDLTQSSFSFSCVSPLAETLGCRLAPYTYRPVSITVCNKDPELPIPPSILLVTVDGPSLKANDVISLNKMKEYWGGDVKAGDVFLTAGDRTYWWDDVAAWFSGEKTMVTKGQKYQLFYITKPVPVGQCVEFGKDETGEDTLFLIAAKGAKVNTQHIIQVSVVEINNADKVVNWSEETVQSVGSWFARIPIVGSVLGGIAAGILTLVLFPASSIANVFAMSADRTVFASGAYKFLVAYPYMEILIVIGVIGVVGAVITKMMKIW